jgi:D-alanyl-D-alanine carboxypeptidase
MTLARGIQGLAVVLTAFVAAGSAAAPAAVAADRSRDRALTRAVEAAMRETEIPGAIVGVWQDGKAPYVRAFGVRDRATDLPMSPRLHMRIGSETKTFTVTALLQLAAEGELSLDDPIDRYVRGVVNGDTVTLRELASMVSGIPSYTHVEAFVTELKDHPRRSWTPAQLLSYVNGAPALFAPGAGFDYSNSNTVLLGLVIEQVSGQPLSRYVEQHLLEPLGMTHTAFPDDAAFPSPHARGYTDQTPDGTVADATRWNPSWGWAAGAMTSTVRDLHVWAEHLATGEGLLPRTLQRERLASVRRPPGETTEYGLGLFNVNGWIGHNGSLPGYQTVAIHRPATGTTVVALVNTDIVRDGAVPSTAVGRAVTKVLSPKHVYDVVPAPAGAQHRAE